MTELLWTAATRYQMYECLGEGAYSQVFRAERSVKALGMRQCVAVKVLQSENAVEMWRNEFESLVRVKSPYCVQVFAFEQLELGPALVLEYVKGLNLRDLVHYGRLSEEHCSEIIAQIQLGLNDLQKFGLCHGDLSPKNVMVDTSGQVRLLDFGLANANTHYTPGFAAPEISAGATAETDLYSLNAIAQFLQRFSPPEPLPDFTLAKTVQAAMDKKSSLSALKTKTVRAGWRIQKSLLHVQVLIMACLVAFSASSQTKPNTNASGRLQIRTQNWHIISIDGHTLGHSPLDIDFISPGQHRLAWQSASSQGSTTVTISEGKTTLIGEDELRSN